MLRSCWRFLPQRLRGAALTHLRGASRVILTLAIPKIKKPTFARPARTVTVIGLLSSSIGLGAAARILCEELERGGITVRRLDASEEAKVPLIPALQRKREFPADEDAVIIAINPDIAADILWGLGPEILRGRRVIAYWVWELERLPSEWAAFRGRIHEIWTPSAFSAEAMAKVFDVPVRIVPHPVALGANFDLTETKRSKARAQLGLPPESFIAFQSISLASSLERKNTLDAITAFKLAFPDDTQAYFIVRVSMAEDFPLAWARLEQAANQAGQQIVLLKGSGELGELSDLYAACDTYLSLHRSEGFGLNLAEMMLAGRPVIATKWSGNMSFQNDECAALVPATPIKVFDPDGIYKVTRATWAQPDLAVAASLLRRMASDRAWREKLTENAKIKARAHLSGGQAVTYLQAP